MVGGEARVQQRVLQHRLELCSTELLLPLGQQGAVVLGVLDRCLWQLGRGERGGGVSGEVVPPS